MIETVRRWPAYADATAVPANARDRIARELELRRGELG
jgi:hypothetical protein